MPKSVWKDEYYVRLYELSREGLVLSQMSRALGVDKRTLKDWKMKRPAVRDAIARGRSVLLGESEREGTGMSFIDFVYGTLKPKLKRIWDAMVLLEDDEKNRNIDDDKKRLLEQLIGKRSRQSLFIHCLIASNFNASEACRRMHLPKVTYDKWKNGDPEFCELLNHVKEVKKDYCEGALMGLVRGGDTSAVIFANSTLNRERGYDKKMTVEHTGAVVHGHVSLDMILEKLSVQAKREVLGAIQAVSSGEMKQLSAPAPDEEMSFEDIEDGDYEVINTHKEIQE